ncbi:SCO-spondin-like isoform X2 [Haliotis rubra]|uniref:SCO-spondin-like isoform X2 n=1 Tax=Haliotis rubra TaxID=36100 RepID=UPI001EE53F36|nr:SCO-spondin-like isoform X2 [Haliotis rubra]
MFRKVGFIVVKTCYTCLLGSIRATRGVLSLCGSTGRVCKTGSTHTLPPYLEGYISEVAHSRGFEELAKMRSHTTLWTVALAITCLMTTTSGQLTGCVSDIMFVLDASASVGVTNFNNMKTDVELFITNTFANYPNARVGYLVYGTSVTSSASLTVQSSQTSLLNSLRGATYPTNGLENTHIGINTAASFLNSQGRSGSPKVMIVITDSISDDRIATINAASNARNAGTTVYVIGVEAAVTGSASLLDTFRQEVQQIASSPSLVTRLDTYSGVSNSLGNLPNTICRVVIINNMVNQTAFTSQTIILSVSLNQNGITGGVWRKNGGSLPNDGRISVTVDNQVQRLTIINAQQSDAATYSFTIAGQSQSAIITVIAGVLTWTGSQTRTIGGTATITVNLVNGNCNLGTWIRNGGVVSTGGRISYTRSGNCVSHTLTITNVQLSDQGTYLFTYNGQQVSSRLTVSTSSAPVNGGFSGWTPWSQPPCSVTCGAGATKTVFRTRTCDNPEPLNGGANCTGQFVENAVTNCGLVGCPVNGGLTQWTQWSIPACSVTCGSAASRTVTRTRSCTNPVPQFGGSDCTGQGNTFDSEVRSCGFSQCPINGGLTQWTQWSVPACSVTCGSAATRTVTRTRSCSNPVPQFGGSDCTGQGNTFDSVVRSCGLTPCPINGGLTQWTQWSVPACSVTCGSAATRTVTRTRSCSNPVPQFGGSDCTGQGNLFDSEVRSCGLTSCPMNGGISQWTEWVVPQCLLTCGTSLSVTATRQRFCNSPPPPSNGGLNCTESRVNSQARGCGLSPCPVNGGVSQWTTWIESGCGATCGVSIFRTARRQRFCNNPFPAFGGRNCSESLSQTETRNCGFSPCPIDGGVSQWTQWSIPSCGVTCGSTLTRTVNRVRFCNSPFPQFGGRNCSQILVDSQIRNCGLPTCAVDGGFNQWSQWSLGACPATCGSGFTRSATRFRVCNSPTPSDGGRNCTGEFQESTRRNCFLTPCPIDGGLTLWTQWSQPTCPFTCGTGIVRTAVRTRSCTNPIPQNGGRNCTGSRFESESRSCNLPSCPVDGAVTPWTEWAGPSCVLTCGTSASRTVTRSRTCTNPPPTSGGQRCSEVLFQSTSRSCGFPECPVDGGLSQWTQWSDPPCSVTCGPSATKVVSRNRLCNSPAPAHGGRPCSGLLAESESRTCGLGNCPVAGGLTQWTQWSDPDCPITCGSAARKTVSRTRTCTNPRPQFGGRECPEPLAETSSRLCGNTDCPVDGGLTQWSQWTDPACPVTCGTAATKRVQRSRTCSNPAPQNNGKPCDGNVTEESIKPCNLAACPVVVLGLCRTAQQINGVGYRYHPTDCDKYLQCYYNPNGSVIGVYRACPFGYYWDQRTLRCDYPWRVRCPLEKCNGSCVANYNMEGSCRAHWVCEKGLSRGECCPMGFRYVVGQGCRPDFYCRDLCPTPCASRDVCDKRPDWGSNPMSYNISVGLLGWMRTSCVQGTYFDLMDCGCGIPMNASCTPDYTLDFNNANALTTARASWLSAQDVRILDGYAMFNGIGHMFFNISQKAPAVDCPLIVRFRFSESQAIIGRRILVSTSDCYKSNTLVIAIDQNSVIFELTSVYGQLINMPVSLAGFSTFEWKTVTMVYDGKMITGVVESANLKYMQQQFAPETSIMQCGMRFASDGSMSTAERFVGNLDSISVYRCNPGNLY